MLSSLLLAACLSRLDAHDCTDMVQGYKDGDGDAFGTGEAQWVCATEAGVGTPPQTST